MTQRRAIALLLAFAPLTMPGAVFADAGMTERAGRLYAQGDLEGALQAFERALAMGDNDHATLVVIYEHLGVLRAGAGDAAGAQRAFESWIELEPDAALPERTSPVVAEPFARARDAVRARTPAPRPDLRIQTAAPVVEPEATRPDPERSGRSSFWTSAWPWVGAGVLAVVAAGTVALVLVNQSDDSPRVTIAGFESQ